VDTPGFDDTNKSDKQVLEMISQWITKTYVGVMFMRLNKPLIFARYRRRATLRGIIYVHRITDSRMSGTPHRNLRLFGELCGDKSARNLVLLTTMWDKARCVKECENREARMKERYWCFMIYHGATVGRFYINGSGSESPWLIVDGVIQRHQLGQALLLQEEMVDIGKRLNETAAGMALFRDLKELINKQNRTIKSHEEQMEGGTTDSDVQKEMDALRSEIENIMKDFQSMKIPLGRRIALFFGNPFRKKAQAVSISLPNLSDLSMTLMRLQAPLTVLM
jgi:hypothetical protein